MHAIRQETTTLYPTENKRASPKAAFVQGLLMGNIRGPGVSQGNRRRALGDIGNLVGALPTKCTVNKEVLLQDPAVSVAADPGRTRRLGTSLANNRLPLKPSVLLPSQVKAEVSKIEADFENAVPKQRHAMRSYNGRGCLDKDISMADELNEPIPTISVVSISHLHANRDCQARAIATRQTLTASLTAYSEEAALGYIEVEMEDAEEVLANIDEDDIGNQLAVLDYVEDIYDFYRKTEIQSCVPPDYMCRQADINEKMRAILIEWLIEVHLKFKLMPETLFLTTNLIDRYLACQTVLRKSLQLVGVTAMLVASKYEEILSPEVQDFVFICDNAYTREQVLDMEKSLLKELKFNLTIPTPYVFMVRFLKAAASDAEIEMLAFFLVELCLTEYCMVKFPPSLLAAAAVYTAQQTLKKIPAWNTTLQHHTGYTDMELRECASMMVSFHKRAGQGNLTVVHKKYSHSQFKSVAKFQAAVFQWENSVNTMS